MKIHNKITYQHYIYQISSTQELPTFQHSTLSAGAFAIRLHQATNRILSKVQKSFWSCAHVNSCSKFTLHINLHILVMFLLKA